MSETIEAYTDTPAAADPSLLNRQIFGSLMRRLRIEADLSRKEFAARVGCSGPLISQTESGRNIPNSRIIDLLVDLYPTQEDQIRLVASVARLSTGTHADDFHRYVAATAPARAA